MPWLVTASLSWTLIWRAVSFSLPTRSSSGRTNVPPPTTTLTPLSPETASACPRSLRTLAPREPAMMSASFAPATLYRLATNAMSRTRMITPVTARNGVDVTKLGIGPCSFFGRRGDRCHHEVGAGDCNHLHLVPCGNLDVGGGGEVVGGAAEDVVDDEGEKEQSASREEASTEYEVGSVHTLSTSDCSLGRWSGAE